MELWIRSQDKETLRLANMLDIYDGSVDEEKCFVIEESGVDLGSYKTKERALEVLDEIQQLIEDLQYMSYAIPNDKFTSYRPNVYNMPKE